MKNKGVFSKDRILILIFLLFAVLIVGLAVIGGFRSYSPVPFWDMWDGVVAFFMRVSEGDNAMWLAQHNEHRIFLSRLLFWADIKWFGGLGWFLVIVNYFLVGLSVLLFYRILRSVSKTEKPVIGEIFLDLFITAWLFLWMQSENLTGAFQSQFIFAQLVPLCALYWLHKSVDQIHAGRNFLIACVFGFVSAGTMANGIIILPLMTFYALLIRQNFVRVGVLFSLSVGMLFLYFHGYHTPEGDGSLWQSLMENPFGLIQFVLLYIGGPFCFLFGKGIFGVIVAESMGLILVGSSIYFAIKLLPRPRKATLMLALLFFILYIGGTALGTAGGRLNLGIENALASRYMTPALMVWAILLILFSPPILASLKIGNKKYLILFVVLAFFMIIVQLHALESQEGVLFERKIAALALELQVQDEKQIKNIYPTSPGVLALAEKVSAQNLFIFGEYPFRDVREQLGRLVQQSALPVCQGYLNVVESINEDSRFVRVSGWIFDPMKKTYPKVIRFLDNQSKMVGYALTGQPRADIADIVGKKAFQSGYRGYLLADQKGSVVSLQGENPSCQMNVKIPGVFSPVTSAKQLRDDVLKIDGFDDELSEVDVTKVEKCDGFLDTVNDRGPDSEEFLVTNLLKVDGWLAVSAEKAILPEAVYVVLTDDEGNRKYLKTHVVSRPDVGAVFGKSELNNSGYSTVADISGLKGRYVLGLAVKMADGIKICPQFKILMPFQIGWVVI
ncbi:MAG: hypothetical protein WCX95_00225 [Candidatus Gracilibacteria bacterium]